MILTSVLCIHSYLQFTQILQSSFSRQPVHTPQYDRFVVCFFGFLGSLAPSCGLARFLPWPAYSERVVLLNLSWVILALLHLVGGRGRSRPVPPSHHEKCVARFWEISRSESQKWANCTNLLNYLQFMKSTSLQNIDRYPKCCAIKIGTGLIHQRCLLSQLLAHDFRSSADHRLHVAT